MAGNEKLVVDYLISQKNLLTLNHLGLIRRIQNPGANGQLLDITSTDLLRTEDSGKKADIFLNGKGVSIKQTGSCFLFNRLQRADMLKVFTSLGFSNPTQTLSKMDGLIQRFHKGGFVSRDRHWSEGFGKSDFFSLLEFLMMRGSPNLGVSSHPADYILTAPKSNIVPTKITCDTFSDYFMKYESMIYLSLRRQWVGQSSRSEHGRASGLAKKPNNAPWVFREVVGTPRDGWKNESEFSIQDRRTVYMIFITVKP
jgi:hypothetical protein